MKKSKLILLLILLVVLLELIQLNMYKSGEIDSDFIFKFHMMFLCVFWILKVIHELIAFKIKMNSIRKGFSYRQANKDHISKKKKKVKKKEKKLPKKSKYELMHE